MLPRLIPGMALPAAPCGDPVPSPCASARGVPETERSADPDG